MNELSTQPDFVITIPGYVEAMHVYEEGIDKNNFVENSMPCHHAKNAYRAIESFLPYDIGTVIVYANSQCETLYKSAWGQEVQLTGKSGDEFKYFVIGKEIVDINDSVTKTCNGRMSYLCPFQNDMTLGVFHRSHQFGGNIIHSSCGGRICILIGTFILFDSNIYHYGNQSKILGGCSMYSISSFSYLVEKY